MITGICFGTVTCKLEVVPLVRCSGEAGSFLDEPTKGSTISSCMANSLTGKIGMLHWEQEVQGCSSLHGEFFGNNMPHRLENKIHAS